MNRSRRVESATLLVGNAHRTLDNAELSVAASFALEAQEEVAQKSKKSTERIPNPRGRKDQPYFSFKVSYEPWDKGEATAWLKADLIHRRIRRYQARPLADLGPLGYDVMSSKIQYAKGGGAFSKAVSLATDPVTLATATLEPWRVRGSYEHRNPIGFLELVSSSLFQRREVSPVAVEALLESSRVWLELDDLSQAKKVLDQARERADDFRSDEVQSWVKRWSAVLAMRSGSRPASEVDALLVESYELRHVTRLRLIFDCFLMSYFEFFCGNSGAAAELWEAAIGTARKAEVWMLLRSGAHHAASRAGMMG